MILINGTEPTQATNDSPNAGMQIDPSKSKLLNNHNTDLLLQQNMVRQNQRLIPSINDRSSNSYEDSMTI